MLVPDAHPLDQLAHDQVSLHGKQLSSDIKAHAGSQENVSVHEEPAASTADV